MKRITAGRRAALIAATAMVPLAIATASAQAATASPAQAGSSASATTAKHCVGQIPYSKTKGPVAGRHATERGFYYTGPNKVCVGQANLRENFNTSTGLAERVEVHNGGASGSLLMSPIYNNNGSGANSSMLTFTTAVDRLFTHPKVTVCVALVTQSTHQVVDNVSICKTLG